MFFEFSLLKGTITLFWLTMPIQDFIAYMGMLLGLYKNYRASMLAVEKQTEHLNLTQEQHTVFIKEARRKYVRDNAKSYYMTVKKLAEITENQVDDKLVLYLEKFAEGMKATFGKEPTAEERDHMSAKADEIHAEVKAAENLAPKEEEA